LISLPPSLSSISCFRLFMKFVDRLRELTIFRPFLLSPAFPILLYSFFTLWYWSILKILSSNYIIFLLQTSLLFKFVYSPFVFSTYKESFLLCVRNINLRCHKKQDTDPLYVIRSQ
jgi:hypothetical protein